MKENSMSMKEIASELGAECLLPDLDARVTDLTCDSRLVKPGSLFFAYKGPESDGHHFLDSAFKNGAVAAVVTDPACLEGRPGLVVHNSQVAFSRICALMEGDPSRYMKVIGITGTNGKTTIHWILYHALNRLGMPCIRIGSLGTEAESGHIERSGKVRTLHAGEIVMTTPSAQEIQKALAQGLENGVMACALETSSHGIHQNRVKDILFNTAIFTNLTPDHLNYHPDMETYFHVKSELFFQLAENRKIKNDPLGGAVINLDCPYGQRLVKTVQMLQQPIFTFGTSEASTVKIIAFEQGIPRSELKLQFKGTVYAIHTPLIGDYNGSNLAASFAALISLGFDPNQVVNSMNDLPVVPGRLEPVGTDDLPVFVDYAHTGIGLECMLKAVKGFVKGDLWVLFGCGGGKDPRKRFDMGEAARTCADKIVLTDDNPKNEDPKKIMEEILSSGCQPEFMIHDRAAAIVQTLKSAKKGDVVVLAGKGHEDYQIIGSQTLHFSDQEEVRKAIKAGLLRKD